MGTADLMSGSGYGQAQREKLKYHSDEACKPWCKAIANRHHMSSGQYSRHAERTWISDKDFSRGQNIVST